MSETFAARLQPDPPRDADGLPSNDPYREPILILLVATAAGAIAAWAGGVHFVNPLLVDAALALAIAAGVLAGVSTAQRYRRMPKAAQALAAAPPEPNQPPPGAPESGNGPPFMDVLRAIRLTTVVPGVICAAALLWMKAGTASLPLRAAGLEAGLCLCAAGLAATAARYLAGIPPDGLPEAPALAKGARALAWLFIAGAAGAGLAWAGERTPLLVLHWVALAVIALVCRSLIQVPEPTRPIYVCDSGVLNLIGSRANLVASVLDAGERQLGIDLRSTWALSIVRNSLEPLALGLALIAWLSTSFTVVGVQQCGMLEHLGVAAPHPLAPGLHLHYPWPIDTTTTIPVEQVQELQVGHEGVEKGGPENVLWSVEHAPNEYTLVLGNGRDLVTVDAAVQYRIVDPAAWRYRFQDPEQMLSALAYRAVMKATINRDLEQVLSQNLALVTSQMRDDVQRNADALGLGVQILAYQVGGMHPPVPVGPAYEDVVSAQIEKATAVTNAEVYTNQLVPAANSQVLRDENGARAQGAQDLAVAAGQAWAFRTLEAQYRVAPDEYRFRRRLEALEGTLAGLKFTIVDYRFLRDGGELWFNP